MGLSRGKLRRLERDAEREMVTLVCQECGEEFRVAEDTGPALVAWDWQQRTGAESYQPTPKDVFTIVDHEHGAAALVKKATGETWPLTIRGAGICELTE
jgi:hypothetical protein